MVERRSRMEGQEVTKMDMLTPDEADRLILMAAETEQSLPPILRRALTTISGMKQEWRILTEEHQVDGELVDHYTADNQDEAWLCAAEYEGEAQFRFVTNWKKDEA